MSRPLVEVSVLRDIARNAAFRSGRPDHAMRLEAVKLLILLSGKLTAAELGQEGKPATPKGEGLRKLVEERTESRTAS